MIKITKSNLERWLRCPKLYEYIDIKGIEQKTTIAMQIGKIMHEYFSQFFKVLNYEELSKCKTDREIRKFFLDYQPEVPKLATRYARNFLDFEINRFKTLSSQYQDPLEFYKPAILEEYLEAKDYVKDATLVGKVDRVDWTSQRTFAVLEYKVTGTLRERDISRETTFYGILLEHSGKYTVPVTHLVGYTPVTNEYFVTLYTKQKENYVKRRIEQMIRAVLSGEFVKRQGDQCFTCQFAPVCLEQELDKDYLLEVISEQAYSIEELSEMMGIQREVISSTLESLYEEGLVTSGFKGQIRYWWKKK